MSFYHAIAEKVVLPISDLVTNQRVSGNLQFLLQSRYWTRQQIDDFQQQQLQQLIDHAYATVPYYRDLFDQLNLKPEDIRSKADLQKLPVLTKATIRREKERFISTAVPAGQRVKKSSSGSTGEPLHYYTNKAAYSMNLAANLRGWYEMGFRLGDKYMKISQNGRTKRIKRLQDQMSRNLYVKADQLDDENLERILKQIENTRPKVIRCYPDPLLFLARYKRQHPEFSYSPHCINTTGNILHPETRREIEAAFQCKIFDSYSSEGNACVFECSTHTCYHSSEEYGISEILDENGAVISNGVGRLISTDLWNLAHPFIRYDTQDLVQVNDEPCSCGKSLLRIDRILGRDNEVLDLPNGKRFIVHNFTIFFSTDTRELRRSVDQFQVVRQKDNSVLFRLLVNEHYGDEVEDYIKATWEPRFSAPVHIELVPQIPLTPNGKRRFVIMES